MTEHSDNAQRRLRGLLHHTGKTNIACVAGSQKLEKPMTVEEAKKFCEEKILTKNK